MPLTDRLRGLDASAAVKVPCLAATTANITLSGEQTIDGVAVVEGDRVLVKDQTDATDNGIYNVSGEAWTRATDFDGSRDVVGGTQVAVLTGSANADSSWRVAGSASALTVGTDELEFEAGGPSSASGVIFTQSGNSTSRSQQSKSRDILDIRDFGAVSDGTTDASAAIQKALDEVVVRGWGTVRIDGNYALSSTALAAMSGIDVPNNCEIDMRGANLTVTGTTACFKFVVANVSNVKIHGGRIYDNSQASSLAPSAAIISVFHTPAATADMRNILIEDLDLHNCKGVGWIEVSAYDPAHNMHRVAIRDIRASSYDGNTIDPASVSVGAHVVYFLATSGGDIYDFEIENITVNGEFIKGSVFVLAQYGTNPASVIERGSIRNIKSQLCGQDNDNDSGCYDVQVYGSTRYVTVDGVTSYTPRDCAVYTAGGMDNMILNITCYGQNSSADGTLPKGAVAMASPVRYIVDGVNGRNNYHDIDLTCNTFAWVALNNYRQFDTMVVNDTGKVYRLITAGTSASSGGPTGTGSDIVDGVVSPVNTACHWEYIGDEIPLHTIITNVVSSRPTAAGFRLSSAAKVADVAVSDFKIRCATSTGITVRNDLTTYYNNLQIRNGEISTLAAPYGIDLFETTHASPAKTTIRNVSVKIGTHATAKGIRARGQTGVLTIEGCDFDTLTTSTSSAVGLEATSSTKLILRNIDFLENFTTGQKCIEAGATCSAFEIVNVQFHIAAGGATKATASSPGLAMPSWVAGGYLGQTIQNLDPAAGEAMAWINLGTTTWVATGYLPLEGSATYDPGSLADGAGVTTTVTVTGAALGDYASASFSLALADITLTAWVSAANTVSVRFQNESTGTLDLASGTLRALVRKSA